MFQLLCLETQEVYTDEDGFVVQFTDGAEAAREAVRLSQTTSQKYQPRQVRDPNWQLRESNRFYDGTYTGVPSNFPVREYEHFVHMSRDRPGLIAYTESADKGELDRQTPIRPGAYIQKFWGDTFDQREIDQYIGLIEDMNPDLKPELSFATTAAEIENVYVNGPHSCMGYEPDHFKSCEHPVRVYAAGDLAVAYIRRPSGTISARALCWPDKKQRSTIYGAARLLKPLLEAAGFQEDELVGAKMRLVRDGDNVVLPYIDSTRRATVSDDGKHLVISRYGPIEADDTGGLSTLKISCSECEEAFEPEYGADLTLDHVCADCERNLEYFCDGLGETIDNSDRQNDAITMANGDTWSQQYFDEHGAHCYYSGQAYPRSDLMRVNEYTFMLKRYFHRHYFICSISGEAHAKRNSVTLYNGKLAAYENADYCDITDTFFAPIEVSE